MRLTNFSSSLSSPSSRSFERRRKKNESYIRSIRMGIHAFGSLHSTSSAQGSSPLHSSINNNNHNVVLNISGKFVIVDGAHNFAANELVCVLFLAFCCWQWKGARVMSRSLYIDINKNFNSFVNTFFFLISTIFFFCPPSAFSERI